MADINGDNTDQILTGTDENDNINGGSGNETIITGDGVDNVNAGDGDDTIYAGEGTNSLNGNDGADTFIIQAGETVTNQSDSLSINGGGNDVDADDNDTLDISDLLANGYDISGNVNINNGEDYSFTLVNSTTGHTLHVNANEIENFVTEVAVCFTPGTSIATPRGLVRVETLQAGDKVLTRDNGVQEIRWIGEKQLSAADFAVHDQLTPVLIQKGALGNDLPERDMMVSPQHRVLINSDRAALYFNDSEVLAPAIHLVGMPGIFRATPLRTSYIHFLCDNHEVVLSDGVWTETFQPGVASMGSLQRAQREEVTTLFPELKDITGLVGYAAARKTLKRHETQILMTH